MTCAGVALRPPSIELRRCPHVSRTILPDLAPLRAAHPGRPAAVPRPPPQGAQRGWYTRRLLPGRLDVLVREGSVKPRGDSSDDKWGSFRVTSSPEKKTCASVCPKHHRSWAFSGCFWPCSLSSSSWLLDPMEPRGWPWPGPVTAWLSGLPPFPALRSQHRALAVYQESFTSAPGLVCSGCCTELACQAGSSPLAVAFGSACLANLFASEAHGLWV